MGRSSAGGDLLFLSTRKSLSTPVVALKSPARIKEKIFEIIDVLAL